MTQSIIALGFAVRITAGSLPQGLHSLDLSRNKIAIIEGLRDLTRLRVLNLSYNRISRIGHGKQPCMHALVLAMRHHCLLLYCTDYYYQFGRHSRALNTCQAQAGESTVPSMLGAICTARILSSAAVMCDTLDVWHLEIFVRSSGRASMVHACCV
jgi:hypothetical protein